MHFSTLNVTDYPNTIHLTYCCCVAVSTHMHVRGSSIRLFATCMNVAFITEMLFKDRIKRDNASFIELNIELEIFFDNSLQLNNIQDCINM